MASHAIPVETVAQSKHGDCLRARAPWDGTRRQRGRQHRADGPPRHRVPRRRGRTAPVHHPRRHRLRARRRRYEGGAGDELFRARRVREIRRRAGASGLPVHRRRGNRQPGRPRRSSRHEARRARVVFNSEPGRVSGNVVTGRKGGVFMASASPARPPIPAPTSPTASARSRNWPARSRRSMR